jgi:hypothetical protein
MNAKRILTAAVAALLVALVACEPAEYAPRTNPYDPDFDEDAFVEDTELVTGVSFPGLATPYEGVVGAPGYALEVNGVEDLVYEWWVTPEGASLQRDLGEETANVFIPPATLAGSPVVFTIEVKGYDIYSATYDEATARIRIVPQALVQDPSLLGSIAVTPSGNIIEGTAVNLSVASTGTPTIRWSTTPTNGTWTPAPPVGSAVVWHAPMVSGSESFMIKARGETATTWDEATRVFTVVDDTRTRVTTLIQPDNLTGGITQVTQARILALHAQVTAAATISWSMLPPWAATNLSAASGTNVTWTAPPYTGVADTYRVIARADTATTYEIVTNTVTVRPVALAFNESVIATAGTTNGETVVDEGRFVNLEVTPGGGHSILTYAWWVVPPAGVFPSGTNSAAVAWKAPASGSTNGDTYAIHVRCETPTAWDEDVLALTVRDTNVPFLSQMRPPNLATGVPMTSAVTLWFADAGGDLQHPVGFRVTDVSNGAVNNLGPGSAEVTELAWTPTNASYKLTIAQHYAPGDWADLATDVTDAWGRGTAAPPSRFRWICRAEIVPAADTYLEKLAPRTVGFGGGNALMISYVISSNPSIQNVFRTIVRFDLTPIQFSRVTAATLMLSYYNSTGGGGPSYYSARRCGEAWVETQADWTNRDGSNPWSQLGGTLAPETFFSGIQFDLIGAEHFAPFPFSPAGCVSLTNMANTPSMNYGMVVMKATEAPNGINNEYAYFRSKEYGGGTQARLVVWYKP